MPAAQAEACVSAQQEILSQALDNTLATRQDLQGVEKSLRSDMERIERKQIEHDGEFKLVKWMMGALIALTIANFAKQFF